MSKLVRALRAAGVGFSRDGCAFLAQAIAFNAVFAIFPLALLGTAVLAQIYGTAEGQQKALALISTLVPEAKSLMASNIDNVVRYRGYSGAFGLIGLVWSGKNLFLALSYALDRALGVPKGRPLLKDIAFSLIMLPVVGLLLFVATSLPLALALVARYLPASSINAFTQISTYAGAALIVFFVTALLYTLLPNRTPKWWFGIPGALLSAIAWNPVQIAFTLYTTHTNFLQFYGLIAAVVALMFWFYIMGTIFLYGAEFCAEWYDLREPAAAAAYREEAAAEIEAPKQPA